MPSRTGAPRWRYTHAGVVYITDETSRHEITSWRLVDAALERGPEQYGAMASQKGPTVWDTYKDTFVTNTAKREQSRRHKCTTTHQEVHISLLRVSKSRSHHTRIQFLVAINQKMCRRGVVLGGGG